MRSLLEGKENAGYFSIYRDSFLCNKEKQVSVEGRKTVVEKKTPAVLNIQLSLPKTTLVL